jgi:peptidoglycan biosynthesis protein MviN/MurJ (putative lipid II flippase)
MEPSGDDDRRVARGNAFARAVQPDDDKARSPVMYVLFGLLSLVLATVFVAALVLPPLFTHTLIIRGLHTGRPGMLAAGIVMALVYFMVIYSVGKRLMSKPKAPPPEA